MLAKVDASSITSPTTITKTRSYSMPSKNIGMSWTLIDTYTVEDTGSMSYNITWSGSYSQAKLRLQKNGSNVYESSNYESGKSGNFNVNKGDVLTAYLYGYSSSGSNYTATVRYTNSFNKIDKKIFTHKCLPRELKAIGNKALGTLFGMHIDNTRYTGENE